MASGMPEIGSRISLISNADIRYEGKLFAVDPEECTIALSSVRSYGTEDRSAKYAVPAQNQVYEYILFRGSDIKDIRVLTTTIPNDPAIVQLSVPPSINDPQFQVRSSGYQSSSMSSMTMPNAPSTSRGGSQTFQNSFLSGSGNVNIPHSVPKSQLNAQNASEDESRSSTPSTQNTNITHKNTQPSVRAQNITTDKVEGDQNSNQSQRRQNSYGNRDNKVGQSGNRYLQPSKQQQYQQQRYQQQPRYPQQQPQQRYMHQQSQYRDYNNRENQYRNYTEYRDPYASRQYMQPLRNGQRNENWSNYGMNNRRGTRTNQTIGMQQNYQSSGYQNQSRKPKNTLKFEDDYDFEQANTEFENVRSQLAKTKLDETYKVNGDVECKKEDSGNEVSAEENEPENDEKQVFYDKVKSFFDQISYEAIERSKGHTQRMDWKTERKINSETFGSVALRRNANFRGRMGGNYYSYPNRTNALMNNNYRGAYRSQGNQNRRQYNPVNRKTNESIKENQSA